MIIKGFARDWVSQISWATVESAVPADHVMPRILSAPIPEQLRGAERSQHLLNSKMAFGDAMATIRGGRQYCQVYATESAGPFGFLQLPASLKALAGTTGKSRCYLADRFFCYSQGYTDWHNHESDETLTVQVIGKKEFALVAPRDHDKMAAKAAAGGVIGTDPDLLKDVQIYRAVLEPGDLIYLPVYWWHLARTTEPGLTVAATFPSPLHTAGDLRLAPAREVFDEVRRKHRRHLPLAAAAAAWAGIRNRALSFDPRWALPDIESRPAVRAVAA
jgi:hypothetical protein